MMTTTRPDDITVCTDEPTLIGTGLVPATRWHADPANPEPERDVELTVFIADGCISLDVFTGHYGDSGYYLSVEAAATLARHLLDAATHPRTVGAICSHEPARPT